MASGGTTKLMDVQKATLLHVIEDEALEIYNTLIIAQRVSADGTTIATTTSDILNAFKEYCNPEKNVA